MDTDTPPDPQGVPFHVALETLLEKRLVEALRAAGAAPLDEAPKARTSDWWKGGRTYPLNDAARRDHLLRPPRKALLDALRSELAAGHILCAGREKGAGAADRHTFVPSDWQHPETLRTSDWRFASARINGRVYVDLLFWRRTASESRHAATSLSTGNAMENGTTPVFPAPASGGQRHRTKIGYDEEDMALMPELHRLVTQEHLALSNAALTLAAQAKGYGSDESKAKRLDRKYREWRERET